MLDITDDYDQEDQLNDVRTQIRDATDNIFSNPDDQFRYDAPQETMYENFFAPKGERIEQRVNRFEP